MLKDTIPKIAGKLGNEELLKLHKTAFLCSRVVPASIVLKSYDWAIEQRKASNCVISGFHSRIEKDVLHYLLKGEQPLILALARGLKKQFDPQFEDALAKNRLLIITLFKSSVRRASQETAHQRNGFMAELAEEIFVAYGKSGGKVERLSLKWLEKGKRLSTFNVVENSVLIAAGAHAI